MKKLEAKRAYTLPDAALITTTKVKVAFIRRDQAEFTPFGITQANIDALDQEAEAFSDLPTDNEIVVEQMLSTELKKEKADEIKVAVRNIMGRVSLRFGNASMIYKKFGTENIAHASDSELYFSGKLVAHVGKEYLAELAENGLTQERLDELVSLCNAYETLLIEQKVSIANRSILQEERILAGNRIYKMLVSYLNIGLTIWETSSFAKYNDYLLE